MVTKLWGQRKTRILEIVHLVLVSGVSSREPFQIDSRTVDDGGTLKREMSN